MIAGRSNEKSVETKSRSANKTADLSDARDDSTQVVNEELQEAELNMDVALNVEIDAEKLDTNDAFLSDELLEATLDTTDDRAEDSKNSRLTVNNDEDDDLQFSYDKITTTGKRRLLLDSDENFGPTQKSQKIDPIESFIVISEEIRQDSVLEESAEPEVQELKDLLSSWNVDRKIISLFEGIWTSNFII